MGDAGLFFDANCAPEISVQQRIWALDRLVQGMPGVVETMVGMSNLLVVYDPLAVDADVIASALKSEWAHASNVVIEGKLVEVEVEYGGEHGPDLKAVAENAGMSEREVVDMHSSAEYRVFAVGSSPGFGYLSGLPARIAMQRRATPIPLAEAGSVLIGGTQTGVTSTGGPTGWYVIGRSRQRLFDPLAAEPCQIAPGDRIKFVVANPAGGRQ